MINLLPSGIIIQGTVIQRWEDLDLQGVRKNMGIQ